MLRRRCWRRRRGRTIWTKSNRMTKYAPRNLCDCRFRKWLCRSSRWGSGNRLLASVDEILGRDTSAIIKRRPKSPPRKTSKKSLLTWFAHFGTCSHLCLKLMTSSLRSLEDHLDGSPSITTMKLTRGRPVLNATAKKADSTYGLFVDRSGEVSVESLMGAGWPLAEIQQANDYKGTGIAFRARVDHASHDVWWRVLPTHSSPFGQSPHASLSDGG